MRSYQNHNCGVSCLQPYTSNHINHLISLMNTVMEERIVFHLHLYSPLSCISCLMPFWRKGVSFLLIHTSYGNHPLFETCWSTLCKAHTLPITLFPTHHYTMSTQHVCKHHRLWSFSWTEKCRLHQVSFNCPLPNYTSSFNSLQNSLAPSCPSVPESRILHSLVLLYCKLWQCFECPFPTSKTTFHKFFKCNFSSFLYLLSSYATLAFTVVSIVLLYLALYGKDHHPSLIFPSS